LHPQWRHGITSKKAMLLVPYFVGSDPFQGPGRPHLPSNGKPEQHRAAPRVV